MRGGVSILKEGDSTQNHKADVGDNKINNSDYVAVKTKTQWSTIRALKDK